MLLSRARRCEYEDVDYAAFVEAPSAFPQQVKMIVFLDIWYSGRAIQPLSALANGRPGGLTIVTSTVRDNTAAGGEGWPDSSTEDFLEEAGDMDKDGKANDFSDRWLNMQSQGGGQNPQRFMPPGQTRMCSTD